MLHNMFSVILMNMAPFSEILVRYNFDKSQPKSHESHLLVPSLISFIKKRKIPNTNNFNSCVYIVCLVTLKIGKTII